MNRFDIEAAADLLQRAGVSDIDISTCRRFCALVRHNRNVRLAEANLRRHAQNLQRTLDDLKEHVAR